jgi:hypothetical protein
MVIDESAGHLANLRWLEALRSRVIEILLVDLP